MGQTVSKGDLKSYKPLIIRAIFQEPDAPGQTKEDRIIQVLYQAGLQISKEQIIVFELESTPKCQKHRVGVIALKDDTSLSELDHEQAEADLFADVLDVMRYF